MTPSRVRPRNLPTHPRQWSPVAQRATILGLVALALIASVGTLAWITNRSDGRSSPAVHRPTSVATTAPSESVPPAGTGTGSVPKPPHIRDPLAYARAAAGLLWSYDTRATSRDQELAGVHAWLATSTKYANWTAIKAQIPDPVLWARMADNTQYATATIAETHFPSAFKAALTDDPAALTQAYIYAVTVTGTQHIAWRNGGAGAEARAVTLAVQCRPNTDCALVDIAPQVEP